MESEIFKQHIGKMLYCVEYSRGVTRCFSSKLIEVRGDILIFETSDGRKMVNRASEITRIYDVLPEPAAEAS